MSLTLLPTLFDDFSLTMPRSWYDYDNLSTVSRTQVSFQPRCDITESDTELIVHAEMPGVRKEDVHVEMMENVLKIWGKKELQKEYEGYRYRRSERNFGEFMTTIRLPQGTDPSSLKTALCQGVLEVRVPKPKSKQPIQIPIE